METLQIVEIISVALSIVFLILLTYERRECWIYGILGSLAGAYVFYHSGYFSETILYLFYAVVGIYGFNYWNARNKEKFVIKRMPILNTAALILLGLLVGFGLGYVMSSYTRAEKPYYDAMSSSFGVIATFLELYKYHVAWSFWIVINGYTIWLYGIKELNILAFQMIIYTVLSIYGFVSWRQKLKYK